MADEDGIGHSMTINNELRLCGMTGDDKEDDVRTDVGELFGCSATDPILLDQHDDPAGSGAGADATAPADGQTGSTKQQEPTASNRPSTSKI